MIDSIKKSARYERVINTIKKVVSFNNILSQRGHKMAKIEIGVSIPPSILVHLPPLE